MSSRDHFAGRFAAQEARKAAAPVPYETDILYACMDVLCIHPRVAWVARMNTGGMTNQAGQFVKFGFKGLSDIIGQLKTGQFLAVECKRPGQRLTPDQEAFLRNVNKAGGLGFMATSVDDVIHQLQGSTRMS